MNVSKREFVTRVCGGLSERKETKREIRATVDQADFSREQLDREFYGFMNGKRDAHGRFCTRRGYAQ